MPNVDAEPDPFIVLETLPCDVLNALMLTIDLAVGGHISATCKKFHALFAEAAPTLARRHALHLLTMKVPRASKVFAEERWAVEPIDWQAVVQGLRKLKRMRPPGCPFQKYLRHLQGVAADDPEIIQRLLGVSMLPSSVAEAVDAERGHWTRATVAGLAIAGNDGQGEAQLLKRNLLGYPWALLGYPWVQSVRTTFVDEFSMRRFLQVLTWATADAPRLRLLMAEIQQISCRGTERFVMELHRQVREDGASAIDAMSRGEQRSIGCRQLMSFCHLVRIVGHATGAEPRAGEEPRERAVHFWA